MKISSSHEEGCERQWAVNTKEFIGDGKGNLKALKIVDLEWKIGESGKAQFVEIEGSAREIPCDLALLAMGFVHPQHEGLINDLAVELDERGNVRAAIVPLDKIIYASIYQNRGIFMLFRGKFFNKVCA